jgi:hypothetical protein
VVAVGIVLPAFANQFVLLWSHDGSVTAGHQYRYQASSMSPAWGVAAATNDIVFPARV